jgi:hypothetical protein
MSANQIGYRANYGLKASLLYYSHVAPRDSSTVARPPLKLAQGKRLHKDAGWDRIRRKILDRIGDGSVLSRTFDPDLLHVAASSFTNQVNAVLEEEVSNARAYPYTKRWWTKKLSTLRDEITAKRNRITTMRRRGDDTIEAIREADVARRLYHDEMDRKKKQYWKNFLDDPNNIWKAARYARGASAASSIPDLKVNNREYRIDEEKVGILIATFFLKQPEPV